MPASKAQLKAVAKYKAKAYKRIPLDYPASDYDELKNTATRNGETVNGFIKLAISERMEKLNREQKRINQSVEENQTK